MVTTRSRSSSRKRTTDSVQPNTTTVQQQVPPALSFDLKEQLAFYGSYHHTKGNQLIHLIFVPLIWWSAGVFLAYTPVFAHLPLAWKSTLPSFVFNNFVLNGSFIATITYILYYIALDPVPGLIYTPVLFTLYLSANAFYATFGDKAWIYALIAHILSWYMQIHVGHLMIEGRKPALMDSFFQSLVLAPFFVFYEFLFMFGWNQPLQDELNTRIVNRIKMMDSQKKVA